MDDDFDYDLEDERSRSRSPRRRSRASSSDSESSDWRRGTDSSDSSRGRDSSDSSDSSDPWRGREPSSSPSRSETPPQIPTVTGDRTSRAVTTKFLLAVNKGERTVHSVAVAGTFTGWIAIPLYFANGCWEARLGVDPGNHQYKFIVDGVWVHDDAKHNVANDQGTRNNTLVIFPGANVAEVPSSVLKHVKSGKVFRYSEKREAAARAKKEAKGVEAARIEAGRIKNAGKQGILTPLKLNPNVDAFVPKHLQIKDESVDLGEEKLSEIRAKNEIETNIEEAIKEMEKTSEDGIKEMEKTSEDGIKQMETTSEDAIKWRVGDECVAKWRGRYWYNGRILEIIHDQVLVKYLDCGDEDYASLDELKPAGSLTQDGTMREEDATGTRRGNQAAGTHRGGRH